MKAEALDALYCNVAVLGVLGVGISEFRAGDAGVVSGGTTQVLLQQLLAKIAARSGLQFVGRQTLKTIAGTRKR